MIAMLLAVGGLSLSALPMILLVVLAVVLFLALLYWILGLFPPVAPYAGKIVLIVGGIILLLFIISLINGGDGISR